jgi:putative copper export protein
VDEATLTWLVRYGHVLSAAIWTGGYAALVILLYPLLGREDRATIARIAEPVARFLSYAGTATFVFGLVLIYRTRGYGTLGLNEWGMIVIVSIVLATAVLGIGDSALRPALRRVAETGDVTRAQRMAVVSLALLIVAIGIMTRALYASS